ncbi:MAG: NAD(P)H-hydrate dehydratase [Desulfobulbaceae bacterium]|nr:NAD(P)H-hydrate dehydratase [Desulfobulbaceae bacterium]
MKLATATQMREFDRIAIEDYGIPGMVLMENAGRGTVDFMCRKFGPVHSKSVPILIGPGNNGGDGLVIARRVHQLGGKPFLFYLTDPQKLQGDAGANQRIVNKLPIPSLILNDTPGQDLIETIKKIAAEQEIHSIVDALFGTGLTRKLSGGFKEAVDAINRLSDELYIPVTAVDIPSGLESDSGAILGSCIRATITATYGLAKPAHFQHGGETIGQLEVVDIGIPPEVTDQPELKGETLDRRLRTLLSPRATATHKGGCGHLLIIAGSQGKTGAAILSCLGALHGGTGLVTLATPQALNPIMESNLIEAMTIPLPCPKPFPSIADYDIIRDNLKGKKALVIGPGIGTEEETIRLVLQLYKETEIPMIIDADGLNALANHQDLLSETSGPRIFTPHPGEMGRLLNSKNKDIQANRIEAAAKLIRTTGTNTTVVLKGAGTICYNSSGDWAINTSGNPGMAAGGMGDVLSGLIGGLIAQGYDPWDSGRLAVYLHSLAADLIAQKQPWGYQASQVAAEIPHALSNLLTDQS